MAISVNWPTRAITVSQADTDILTLVSGTLYRFDTLAFQKELKGLEDDSDEGMAYPDTHEQALENTISGVTYVRAINIINGYTVTFSPDSQWSVVMDGATNNNFADVLGGVLNQNQVQVIPQNSAGNTRTQTAASQAQIDSIEAAITAIEGDLVTVVTDIGALQVDMATATKIMRNRKVTDEATGILTVYEDNGVDVWMTANIYESSDNVQPYRGRGMQLQDRLEAP